MAANFVGGNPHRWKWTTTGNITSGQFLLIGVMPAVALETAVTGKEIAVASGGEWVLAKKAASGTNLTVGGRVYIVSDTTYKVSGVAAAGKLCGFATAIAATGATTGRVVLNGDVPALETQS